MPELRQTAITRLASVVAHVQAGDPNNTIYTVPTGFVLYVTNVVVRDPTATLAGGTSFSFGSSSGPNYFKATVDLSGMTTAGTKYYIISADDTVLTEFAAAALFEVVVTTGATADADATIDLFGYLVAV